jgi:hypothetical protein
LEYLSSKQFKLIVKMTRIETGVTIPKGLFTLYLNVKKVTAKIFWPPYYINTKKKNTVVSDAAAEGTNTNPSGNSETPSGTNVTIVDLVWDESQGRSVRQKRDEILETADSWFGGDSEQTWKKFSDNKRNQRRVSER